MKRRTPTKWTTESYVKKMLEISPTITVVGEYINMASPIECRCDVCGYKWSPSAQNLIRGTGCPECAKTAQSNRMKARKTKKTEWTQDSFIKRIYEIDPSLEILGEYKNGASAIQCRCKKCNYEWAPSANNLLNNRSHCPKCSKENAKSLTRMTHEEFVKRVADNNKSIEVIGQYKNTKSRIECRCKECGNVWFPTADSLLSGRKCRVCSYIENGPKLTKSQDDFLQALQEVNPSIEVLGDYCGVYDPIRCRCSVCNHEWDAVPHYLLTGRGCPECCRTSTSFVEQAIYNAFTNALGEKAVLSRDKTAIGKELDIYIPELKTAIEPGSWYYHCSKQSADKEKRTLCNAKGIKLFFVFYDYDGPIITDPNTLCFSESLSSKYDREKLTNLICLLFEKCSIPKSFSSKEWTEIYTNAYLQSRRITTPVFKARIKEISPNIEVLGEYFNSKSKIKCRCSTCGKHMGGYTRRSAFWKRLSRMCCKKSQCAKTLFSGNVRNKTKCSKPKC